MNPRHPLLISLLIAIFALIGGWFFSKSIGLEPDPISHKKSKNGRIMPVTDYDYELLEKYLNIKREKIEIIRSAFYQKVTEGGATFMAYELRMSDTTFSSILKGFSRVDKNKPSEEEEFAVGTFLSDDGEKVQYLNLDRFKIYRKDGNALIVDEKKIPYEIYFNLSPKAIKEYHHSH